MDVNSNLNQSLSSSGHFNALPQQQNVTGTTFTPEQFIAFQQMQLNAQMGNLTLTNGLQPDLYQSQNVTSPIIFHSMPNFVPTSSGLMAGVLPISPTNPMHYMPLPQSTMDSSNPGVFQHSMQSGQSFDPSSNEAKQQLTLMLQLQNNIPSAVDLRKTVRRDIEGHQNYEEPQYSPRSPQFISTPINLSSPNTPNSTARRQLVLSETSSTTSSGPASPSSGIGMPNVSLSDNSPGPNSPKSPIFVRHFSEPQTTNVQKAPTRASSLKIETKYPQDKCYRCMKKVYPMEKIGPVKDVVYHKGCFTCKTCGTKLNLKNFCHNKIDDWDIHVYCKSHCDQGSPQPFHIDANSVLIKGALSAPKLDKINEQIRGSEETHKGGKLDANAVNIRSALSAPKKDDQINKRDSRYHLDLQSLELAHARNVPATDLQTGNKIKQQAWKRNERKSESVPPTDVVRYSDTVPEYDMESYKRLQVENNPDYDRL
ncbi:uncharacterized protein LOC127731471 [Mytilus californianus]|uniref:uncharacterized protein LOC127731471 n=1 Tax=Mytilus californianus TaxID=6549 RepID=UPI00224676E8|nr:uncharacterized protein LOC127731471 [Mytilus californianus]